MMIRSTRTSTKFSNAGRRSDLTKVMAEARRLMDDYIDILWDMESVPKLLPKDVTSRPDTWLSARMRQAVAKQASGIVRGVRRKGGSKPRMGRHTPLELDSRFVTLDLDNDTSFDGWLAIGSIGDRLKISLPFKRTKHFNRMHRKGQIKTGVRLHENHLTFMFDIEEPETTGDTTLGIDIGLNKTVSCSDGVHTQQDSHDHTLKTITQKLARKTKGSKAFKRAQSHRLNYIGWSINQLDLSKVSEVRIEDIKNLRKGKKSSRLLSHWTYTDIFRKIRGYCEEQGVPVLAISPTYTSRRCHECGWTQKSNRLGEQFKCGSCGNSCDADLNAAKNIAVVDPIEFTNRRNYDSDEGFFWTNSGKETIVPSVTKTTKRHIC